VVKATTKRNCLRCWEEGVQFKSQRGTSEINRDKRRAWKQLNKMVMLKGLENYQWALSTAPPHRNFQAQNGSYIFALS
jgi:hypothetical protein